MEVNIIDGKYIEGEHGHELFQVSQKVVLCDIQKKLFLLVKVTNESCPFAKKYGIWDLPGGRVNVSENLQGSLLREVSEEIGKENISIDLSNIIGTFITGYNAKRILNIGYFAEYDSSEEIILSKEHSEYRWVSSEEVLEKDEYGPIIKFFVGNTAKRIAEQSYLDDVRRISSDFENYKRRQKEREKELSSFLTERVISGIIPVLDNFHMATKSVPEESKETPWIKGISYIEKQLEDALSAEGLSVFEVNIGDDFDPEIHESLGHDTKEEIQEHKKTHDNKKNDDIYEDEQNQEKKEKIKITKLLQKGYRLGKRVIRPAKVFTN